MWVWITEDKEEAIKGFRFMGQRFTLDAYVFGQVIWRNVGTLEDPRGLPKGLDFFAAMGSEEARKILTDMGENQASGSDIVVGVGEVQLGMEYSRQLGYGVTGFAQCVWEGQLWSNATQMLRHRDDLGLMGIALNFGIAR